MFKTLSSTLLASILWVHGVPRGYEQKQAVVDDAKSGYIDKTGKVIWQPSN
jgi:hypothetical protein